jgi:isoquinoline 1-oxidoreductase beta subunit
MYSTMHARNPSKPIASRRGFLKGSAVAALVIGTQLNFAGKARAATLQDPPMPNAFIKIEPDSTVTVMIKHLDMGQGNTTGLTTIVADELDADWPQMRSAFAPANAALYNNLFFGPVQGTGGSTAIANSWDQLRRAGAAARAMLIAAAADNWNVPAAEITIAKGVVTHAKSNRQAKFGELVTKAATLAVPTEVKPKDPKDWVYISKHVPRIDSMAKTTGKAVYALDIRRPGMITAMVAHPPRFGGAVKSFDASAAKAVKGVVDVVQIPQGVAVLAKDTWSAMKGREALKVEWDDSNAEKRSSAQMFADYRKLADGPGLPAARRGDAVSALSGAAKVVEAEFSFPFLAHAPMEPLNGVIEIKGDGTAECWAGAQFQTVEQMTVAAVLGLKPEQVTINTVWAGGSFGRRATPNADYFAEMAAIAKASGGKAPVHLVWTREDDIKGGLYRPMFLHRMQVGVDAKGMPVAWKHTIVGQSIMTGTPFERMVKDGIDPTSVEGVSDSPYLEAVPARHVSLHTTKNPVPIHFWRSVGNTHTAFAMESMIDELAWNAGQDPLAFRLALLKDKPRFSRALQAAAARAGWGKPLPSGRARGLAVHESFGSIVAQVAEVSVDDDKSIHVHKVSCAMDCGLAVNPLAVEAQVQGAIAYGLSAVLYSEITLKKGEVQESNFHDYRVARMPDMPEVTVQILESDARMGGVGEPGTPPIAPAVANAVYALTKQRLRSLPLRLA